MTFTSSSYWNRMIPAVLPDDPASSSIIAALDAESIRQGKPDIFQCSTPDWSSTCLPVYVGNSTHPLYTVTLTASSASIPPLHTPPDFQPNTGSDKSALLWDTAQGCECGFAQLVVDHVARTITAKYGDIYWEDSNGLDKLVAGGDPRNHCHRGFPPYVRSVRRNETTIRRVLSLSVYATAPDSAIVPFAFPAYGGENGSGVIPEGAVLQLELSDTEITARGLTGVPLAIARALRDYGAIVRDQTDAVSLMSFDGKVAPGYWSGLGVTRDAFYGKLHWSDFRVPVLGFTR